ncbi:MAG: Mu transposase C-terminal domain-containing protein [Aeromonas veronii]
MSSFFRPSDVVGLPGMPTTVQGVRHALRNAPAKLVRKAASGKGFEYHASLLPKEASDAYVMHQVIKSAEARAKVSVVVGAESVGSDADVVGVDVVSGSAVAVSGAVVAASGTAVSGEVAREVSGELVDSAWFELSDHQREVAMARLAFIRAIETACQSVPRVSQVAAICALLDRHEKGMLGDYLTVMALRVGRGKGGLSLRSLKRWLSAYRSGGTLALAPIKTGPVASFAFPDWWDNFAPFWQKPQKPSMADAYNSYVKQTPGPWASLRQVSYFFKKCSDEVRHFGRMSKQELKAFQAFKRLDFEQLDPNDIWQIDGHTFDALVTNPITGQRFRPEVTMLIDWATRTWVGFSINLAESSISTIDAIRDSVVRHGMFKILYTDNGPGFKNNSMLDQICDVLGGTLARALPYNSQAKGVVERLHHSVLVRLAKRYPSYIGKDMDGVAGTKNQKISLALMQENTKESKQRLAVFMPTLNKFYQDLCDEMAAYNDSPHSALPRVRDYETGKQRHLTPNEVWAGCVERGFEALQGRPQDAQMMCMPIKVVITRRGEIKFMNQVYFNAELVALHGEDIVIRYDFRDGYRVWAFNMDGVFLCEALFKGNSVDAKPVSFIEKAAEKREGGQFKRLVTKAKTLTGQDVDIVPRVDADAVDAAAYQASLVEQGQQAMQLAQDKLDAEMAQEMLRFVIPTRVTHQYRLWEELYGRQLVGEKLDEARAAWVKGFALSVEWREARKMLEDDGEKVIPYQQPA